MGILNNSEEDKIKSAISSGDVIILLFVRRKQNNIFYLFFCYNNFTQVVISTVARLYKAVSGSWDYTSKWGGIVLVKEDKAHFLKIVNLDVCSSLLSLSIIFLNVNFFLLIINRIQMLNGLKNFTMDSIMKNQNHFFMFSKEMMQFMVKLNFKI